MANLRYVGVDGRERLKRLPDMDAPTLADGIDAVLETGEPCFITAGAWSLNLANVLWIEVEE